MRATGSTFGRLVALVAIVALVGVALGLGLGYPISKIEVASDDSVELDQSLLPGTFDPEAALIAQSDLPDSWQPSDADFATFSMIGSPICGQAAEISNQLGTKLDTRVPGPGEPGLHPLRGRPRAAPGRRHRLRQRDGPVVRRVRRLLPRGRRRDDQGRRARRPARLAHHRLRQPHPVAAQGRHPPARGVHGGRRRDRVDPVRRSDPAAAEPARHRAEAHPHPRRARPVRQEAEDRRRAVAAPRADDDVDHDARRSPPTTLPPTTTTRPKSPHDHPARPRPRTAPPAAPVTTPPGQ